MVFERRGEGETLGALGRMGAWIGTRVYTPTLVVTLVFGIILMPADRGEHGCEAELLTAIRPSWAAQASTR